MCQENKSDIREAYKAYRRWHYHQTKTQQEKYRIATAIHLLERNGYHVIAPAPQEGDEKA